MKKSTIGIIACSAFIVIALVAMLVFIFATRGNEPETEPMNFDGTWRIVSTNQFGTVALTEKEFVVFEGDQISFYKDDTTTPSVSSKFTMEGETIYLTDASMERTIAVATDNLILLYETPDQFSSAIRYPNADMTDVEFDTASMEGEWDVICHGGQAVLGEKMTFENNVVNLFQNGSEEPSVTAEYTWRDGKYLVANSVGMEMLVYRISDSEVIFVDTATGYCWELKKAE